MPVVLRLRLTWALLLHKLKITDVQHLICSDRKGGSCDPAIVTTDLAHVQLVH